MVNSRNLQSLKNAIARATGDSASIVETTPVSGGSINSACLLTLDDGRRLFLKSNPAPLPQMFEREAEGLQALADAGALRVPRPITHGDDPIPFLVLEAIDVGSPGPGFFEDFGWRFAQLHRDEKADRYGFEHDNYIGSTTQPNGWMDSWTEFWRECRLGHQLRLAEDRGRSDAELRRLGDRLMDQLDVFLGDVVEPPSLLHGDLWGGNYLCDTDGAAVLIDPAVYYGHREADLAMTRLFGGFQPAFYRAYEEIWPLEPGSDERGKIYELYHLLNHLNLFGGGYRAGCVAILRRLVG